LLINRKYSANAINYCDECELCVIRNIPILNIKLVEECRLQGCGATRVIFWRNVSLVRVPLTFFFAHRFFYPEEGCNIFFRNVGFLQYLHDAISRKTTLCTVTAVKTCNPSFNWLFNDVLFVDSRWWNETLGYEEWRLLGCYAVWLL
jgi:hypothetical protein